VLQPRPTFTWFSVPGAQGYTIQLRPVGGKPIRFTTGSDTVWTLPATEAPLADSTVYEWSVAALPSGRPAAAQRFQMASGGERAELSRLLHDLGTAGLDLKGSGLLPVALAYGEAGFLYEARQTLDALEASGTPLARSVRLLRADILNQIGEIEAAARELALADRSPDF
jgi:hypothetical protein